MFGSRGDLCQHYGKYRFLLSEVSESRLSDTRMPLMLGSLPGVAGCFDHKVWLKD